MGHTSPRRKQQVPVRSGSQLNTTSNYTELTHLLACFFHQLIFTGAFIWVALCWLLFAKITIKKIYAHALRNLDAVLGRVRPRDQNKPLNKTVSQRWAGCRMIEYAKGWLDPWEVRPDAARPTWDLTLQLLYSLGVDPSSRAGANRGVCAVARVGGIRATDLNSSMCHPSSPIWGLSLG